MKKYIWMFFGVALLVVIVAVVFLREEGELKSPQATHQFTNGNLTIEVVYCRPSKRGREIFGALVPYDKIWRVGANEPTEFHTNKDLDFNGQALKAGEYSLWAKPGKESWTVYINSTIPDWGVDEHGDATRDPESDVVVVQVPSKDSDSIAELLTLEVLNADSTYNLKIDWDKAQVNVPFKVK